MYRHEALLSSLAASIVTVGLALIGLLLTTTAMAGEPVEWQEIVEQSQPEPGLRVSYGE